MKFLAILLLLPSFAQAALTHSGRVDLDLIQIDEKGKEHRLESDDGDFNLDWNTKKCEIRLNKSQYVYCTLDTSQDIKNSKGELVMKSMPQAHFDVKMIDPLIRTIGMGERSLKNIISKVVEDTSAARAKGFDLPFYSCGDCEKNGKDLVLWNAFGSYVTREITIQHSYLGYGKKLVLRMKLSKLKANGGAFGIIGNSNAADYGR